MFEAQQYLEQYPVNLKRIDSIEYQQINIGAARIPVAKAYREALRRAIGRFI